MAHHLLRELIMQVLLQNAAHVRSGDKGNTACISVLAYSDELYEVLKAQLSAAQFKAFYNGVITGEVQRYEADGLGVLQFVADGALGGGVSRSLCLDNYGKALCSAILAYKLEVPDRLQNQLRGL
jgi:hypothetical protein